MILCLGTTPALQRTMTFTRLTLDSVNRAADVREYASGKSINVARVAHALGESVLATGFLGGERATAVRRDLDCAGIAHDFLDVDAPTRMCVTVVDQGNGTATELVEESSPAGPSDANRLLAHLEHLLSRAKVLVMSGTLASGVSDDFYARCVKFARQNDVATIVDAKGPPLQRALAEGPTIVKPNRSELLQTFGGDWRAAILGCMELGAEWAVITDGPRETIVASAREFWKIETPKVDVISPIGSGDAFAAGIAVGIVRGEEIPNACALGAACGAANVMTAFAGHVNRPTVELLKNQISVMRV